ncbi:hypothetical protein NPA08_01795 [Mycoplasmopsis citelli]|uniref:hypothetical protein n=1 Tax=Mycoplasmopsis citelli TaxID=171281 RepID=UPI00211532A5|nr:hypothetical protein [Mycoplasmopsis citelli]UUD36545.1 hypothetical protein NPA08_01795 [Mycoplasmopsis citelli]
MPNILVFLLLKTTSKAWSLAQKEVLSAASLLVRTWTQSRFSSSFDPHLDLGKMWWRSQLYLENIFPYEDFLISLPAKSTATCSEP